MFRSTKRIDAFVNIHYNIHTMNLPDKFKFNLDLTYAEAAEQVTVQGKPFAKEVK